MIKIDSAVSYKDMLNIVNPKTGELRHSLMTLKVEGRVKLTSDKYEFTVDDGIVARKLKITQFTLMKLLDWAYLLN